MDNINYANLHIDIALHCKLKVNQFFYYFKKIVDMSVILDSILSPIIVLILAPLPRRALSSVDGEHIHR